MNTLGPDEGTLEVRTYREGVGQAVGDDLIIDVTGWQANAEVSGECALTSLRLEVDPSEWMTAPAVGGRAGAGHEHRLPYCSSGASGPTDGVGISEDVLASRKRPASRTANGQSFRDDNIALSTI